MTMRTLTYLLETAGLTLSLVCAPAGLDREVGDLVVHDRRSPVPPVADGLLLAVGLAPDDEEFEAVLQAA
ncbi:MAG: hypothetical protein WBA87_18235, partial [Microbacterium sp.]